MAKQLEYNAKLQTSNFFALSGWTSCGIVLGLR
jgi:hypothetical protein